MTTETNKLERKYSEGSSYVVGLVPEPPTLTEYDFGPYVLDTVKSYGQSIKDWRLAIKEKRSATSVLDVVAHNAYYDKSVVLEKKGSGYINSFERAYWYKRTGFASYPSIALMSPDLSSATNEAFLKFVSKARSAQRPFQGGVVLGEIRETIRMIRAPGKALSDSLYKFLRGYKKPRGSMKSRARFVANRWLEYRFGILPLLSDIDSGMEALSRIAVKPPDTISVSGKGTSFVSGRSSEDDVVLYVAPISGHGYVTQKGGFELLSGFALVRVYGAIKVSCGPFGYFGLNGKQAFLDFIPTVWELIPYSFLVDYFSNIGSIIESLTLLSSDVAWANRGYKIDQRNQRIVSYQGCDGEGTYYGAFKKLTLHREPFSVSTYVPSLQFKLPGSSTRWTNIAALGVLAGSKSKLFRL